LKRYTLLILLIILKIFQINAFEIDLNTDEFFEKKNSSVFFIKNDTLPKTEFYEIEKIYENQNFVLALKKSLNFLDKYHNKDKYWSHKALYLIADIYDKTNKIEESLKYFKKSLAETNSFKFEKQDLVFSDIELANTLLRVGSSYHKLSISIDLNKNENYLDSIKLSNNKKQYLDSAQIFYEKLTDFSELNLETENIKAKAFSNLSGIYEQNKIYDKAEFYVRKAIEIHKKNNNNLSEAKSINNLGNIFLSQGKYQKSKEVYKEALDLIKNDENPRVIKTKASLYFNLAWAMRKLKDYKAYDFQEISYDIEGNIREREFNGIIEEVASKYNFDSQKEILLRDQENKRLKDQRIFLIIGIIALIIILSLAYKIKLKNLKENNLALELTQVELLQNQKIEKLKSDSQVRILNATIDGKESERKQIAETLHDSVSALLSSANLHLQATRKQFNGSTPVEIDKTQEIILEASHKIRDLSHTLVSSVLLKFGLNFAIKDIAEKYSNSVLKIETNIENTRRYQQNFEIKVYNITQEFVNNILKHSNATNALIELKEKNKKLYITISDDGKGFDKNSINIKDGLGINQIDARIQMMKGEFNIESSLNNGTRIVVILPISEKAALNHV